MISHRVAPRPVAPRPVAPTLTAALKAALTATLALALAACGEATVTGLALPIVPDNGAQFVAAQQAMVTIGCALPGCHATIVGNFKVTANPKDPVALDAEYTLTKAFIDLDAPDASVLLTAALVGNPDRHQPCFKDTQGCAWQIVTTWIAGGDAAAVACTPTEGACFGNPE
ncbi:MAG: hypothetical protein H6701_04595 [Myxococcales bacterium]|nr:hypothetical protein [Myxococcales bacterium]